MTPYDDIFFLDFIRKYILDRVKNQIFVRKVIIELRWYLFNTYLTKGTHSFVSIRIHWFVPFIPFNI